jgi:predicted enzyme related to lactoylglutathione lyase
MKGIYLELHVPDFAPAKDFYMKLGFKIIWERAPEGWSGYVVMERDGSVLCFWGGNAEIYTHPHFKQFPKDTPRGFGVEIVYSVPDIDVYYAEVQKFATVTEPLVTQPWGLRDFRITDPFGYYIRISEPHDIRDSRFAVP